MLKLSPLLKRVLVLDAASCLVMGAALWPAADLLSTPLGLSPALIGGAGMLLIPLGLFILWLGTRTETPAAFVYVVIGGNVIWAIESFVVAFGDHSITPLGSLFVAGQGVFVVGLAVLEMAGFRRSASASVQRLERAA